MFGYRIIMTGILWDTHSVTPLNEILNNGDSTIGVGLKEFFVIMQLLY